MSKIIFIYEPLRKVQENHYDPWGMSLCTPPDTKQTNLNNRYQYNGKELTEDFDVGLYEYGFMWYGAQIAKFVQVDPLADDYTYKSTYDYAENRPISGIDLDGLEYLDANEARIILKENGVHLNLKNMSGSTQRAWKQRNESGRWPTGYIGYPTEIARIELKFSNKSPDALSFDNTMGANDPAYNNTIHKLERRIAKSTGKEDLRVKERSISGVSGGTPKFAGIAIFANLGMWTFDTYTNISMMNDRNLVYEQMNILRNQVVLDINIAIKQNMIPSEYQNPLSINAIMNYVLSGTSSSSDPNITEIGKNIVKTISKNYKTPLKITTSPSTGTTSDNTSVNKLLVKEIKE